MASNTPVVVDKLSKEQFKKALPAGFKGNLTDDMMNKINALLGDVELAQHFKENLLSYTTVLNEGRYKLTDYLNAVRYVSYKLLNQSNEAAYTKTFPDRFQRFVDAGKSSKDISSFVHAYHHSKLVQGILEQTLTPTWVLNAPIYQEAINVQAELMRTATSEKVRTEAANSILNHLKRPETNRVQLDIGVSENEAMTSLQKELQKLAEEQRKAISNQTMTAGYVAKEGLVIEDGEVVDD